MIYEVFICYESTTGTSYAEHLKKALEKSKEVKYNVFLANITLRSGINWKNEIDSEIINCNFFIVVITALTMDSTEVKREYDIARKWGKRIIPFRYSVIDVSETKKFYRLQQIQFSDKYDLANKAIIELKNIIDRQKLIDIEKDSDEFLRRGNLLFNLKLFDEALKLYRKAIKIETNFPEAWANIGLIFRIKKNHKEALKFYERAVEINPDFADAWLDKGLVLEDLNKPEEALKDIEKAIEIRPNFEDAWGATGAILGKLERHEESLKAFNNKLKLNPDDYEIWTLKGCELFELRRYEDAEKAYNVAITLKSDFADVWYYKAILYSLRNDKINTIQFLSEAIKFDMTYKKNAKEDENFKNLWNDEDFKKITND